MHFKTSEKITKSRRYSNYCLHISVGISKSIRDIEKAYLESIGGQISIQIESVYHFVTVLNKATYISSIFLTRQKANLVTELKEEFILEV